jgi:hypothetical protein
MAGLSEGKDMHGNGKPLVLDGVKPNGQERRGAASSGLGGHAEVVGREPPERVLVGREFAAYLDLGILDFPG